MSGTYVLCILGESPSILSNLIWWLTVQEQHPIAGIEVWATGRGARRLADLTTLQGWERLQQAAGRLPQAAYGAAPACTFGFRVHRHRVDGAVIDDVRSAHEAAVVNATLHDRVRDLRQTLPEDIQLVGCLAGGRKTVSAALQTAFCLQARARDRLVHVVLDHAFEGRLRTDGRLAEFVFPEPMWEGYSGVAADEQIVVYDVPFPRLRYLVPRRLSAALGTKRWDEVWPILDANMGRSAAGVLVRHSEKSWTYEVRDEGSGEVLYAKPLTRRLGATMAALAAASPEATTSDLIAWLDTSNVHWAPPTAWGSGADASDLRTQSMRRAISDLRKALENDLPMGLEAFAPDLQRFAMGSVRVEDEDSPEQ